METQRHVRILIDRYVVLLGVLARGASLELLATCKLYGPDQVRLFVPWHEMRVARDKVEIYVRRRGLPRTAARDLERRFHSLENDRDGLVEIVPFDMPDWVDERQAHAFLPALAAAVGADLLATYSTALRLQEEHLGTTIASPAICLEFLFDILGKRTNEDH